VRRYIWRWFDPRVGEDRQKVHANVDRAPRSACRQRVFDQAGWPRRLKSSCLACPELLKLARRSRLPVRDHRVMPIRKRPRAEIEEDLTRSEPALSAELFQTPSACRNRRAARRSTATRVRNSSEFLLLPAVACAEGDVEFPGPDEASARSWSRWPRCVRTHRGRFPPCRYSGDGAMAAAQ